jgi:hypothetical protein
MLNCLKEHKVLIIPVLVILVLIIILPFVEINILTKVGCFFGVSIFIIAPFLGYLYNNYTFRECIYNNEQDKLAVINDLNKIKTGDITIPNTINGIKVDNDKPEDAPAIADWIVLTITDNGNNIIKLKTLQEHFYNRKTDLLKEQKPNTEEIAEVEIYIKKVNHLIARYNLKHPWFT